MLANHPPTPWSTSGAKRSGWVDALTGQNSPPSSTTGSPDAAAAGTSPNAVHNAVPTPMTPTALNEDAGAGASGRSKIREGSGLLKSSGSSNMVSPSGVRGLGSQRPLPMKAKPNKLKPSRSSTNTVSPDGGGKTASFKKLSKGAGEKDSPRSTPIGDRDPDIDV